MYDSSSILFALFLISPAWKLVVTDSTNCTHTNNTQSVVSEKHFHQSSSQVVCVSIVLIWRHSSANLSTWWKNSVGMKGP